MQKRLCVVTLLQILVLFPPPALLGQSLRDKLGNVFGSVLDIQLAGPGEHGNHFRPASVALTNGTINAFGSFIATNVSSFPLSSTEAGLTFDFSTGQPVSTTTSMGPIFAERAQTLGKNRFNLGFNFNFFNLSKIRGVNTDAIRFSFTHQDVGAPGLGDSDNEFDTIDLFMNLDINAAILAFSTTIGVTNNFDVSIAVPFVNVNIKADPLAVVDSFTFFTTDTANHSFGGKPTEPELTSKSGTLNDDATGIGDIAIRAKYNFLRRRKIDLAAMLEYRLPTGDEEDFLGTGSTTFRTMLIVSSLLGNFGPHLNLAYERRNSDLDLDEIELFLGYDQKLSERLTLAVDFWGEWEIGSQIEALQFPQSAFIRRPIGNTTFTREVSLTNIPNFSRDHNLNASFGLKFNPKEEVIIIGNIIIPLNDGGLRSDFISTVGFQVSY